MEAAHHRAKWIAVLIALIAALGLWFMNETNYGVNLFGGNANAASTGCATNNVHYYAKDVESSHFFGPAVTQTTVADQKTELHNRRSCDPALTVAHAYGENVDGYGSLTADQLTAKANQLAADKTAWAKLITDLDTNEAKATATDATMSGSYQTLYMVTQSSGAPLIRHWSTDRPTFPVLRFTWPNGSVFNMKLTCGFQNVAQTFPGIPPLQPQPKPSPSQPPVKYCTEVHIPVPPNGLCPKNPKKDPQSQGNVPTQDVKKSPSSDNSSEVAQPPSKPTDSGNGIPPSSSPRITPSPAPTHIGSGPTVPAPTEPATTPTPVQQSPTANGSIPAPPPAP